MRHIYLGIMFFSAMIACDSGSKDPPNRSRPETQKSEADQSDEDESRNRGSENSRRDTEEDRDSSLPSESSDRKESPVELSFANPNETGTYAVKTLSSGLDHEGYASAVVYYPDSNEASSWAATTLAGGYSNTKEQMEWLGRRFASHGIITLVFTPTSSFTTDAAVWERGHVGGIEVLKDLDQSGPLQGRVDLEALGVAGFSMGGAGTLRAANALDQELKAAIPICAYNPVKPDHGVASLYITGDRDTVAVPEDVVAAFDQQDEGAKALAHIRGLGHGDIIRSETYRATLSRVMVSWYRYHLTGDDRYRTYLDGDEATSDAKKGLFNTEGLDVKGLE